MPATQSATTDIEAGRYMGGDMDLQDELEALAKADEDLRLADERIGHQQRLTEELRRDGYDVAAAVDLLAVLRETRSTMISHRQLILENIDRLKRERPGV